MLICVTGLKGSGKTTVINMIAKNGYDVFIMDKWIHHIYKTNGIGFKLIKKYFGKRYTNKEGVDRKKLGKLVFSNKKQLDKLNKIMIPVMQGKIASLKTRNKLIFVELAIYMFHVSKFKKYFSKIIYISNKKDTQKNIFFKNFSNIKKLPTNTVGKCKNYINSMESTCCYVVENYENKKKLENKIKNFLICFKK